MNLLSIIPEAIARRRRDAARVALAAMVEANRNAPATIQYRHRRASALKHTRGVA